MKRIDKPKEGEFEPYAIMYIGLLPDDGLVLQHLQENLQTTKQLLLSLSEKNLNCVYAEGKWTIKEILAHIIDTERVFVYRALRFARNDKTELTGFEQDDYTANSGANGRDIIDILNEFESVRFSTISFFESLDAKALLRKGVANDHAMSVRAAAYDLAGHEMHHINIIRERYL